MNSSESKIAGYLQDAHVLEGTLRRTLIAHIAVSPRDAHRRLLEDHLRVTTAQERRLAGRLADLKGAPNLAQSAVGAAKGAAALALTLVKGPADALRGTTGDDVELRNAQDECASEALEIAVYDALEAIATELGDEHTAELARRHRAQEEEFLARLRDTVPGLARNVAQNAEGGRRFPLPTIGVFDAARALVRGAQAALGQGEDEDGDTPPRAAAPTAPGRTAWQSPDAGRFDVAAPPAASAGAATRPRPASPVKEGAGPMPPAAPKGRAKATTKPKAAKGKAAPPKPKAPEGQVRTQTTPPAGEPTTPAPAEAAASGRSASATSTRTPAAASSTPAATPAPKPENPDQPLAQYDDMTPYEISELLDHLPEAKLDEVERYERAHEQREQVLEAIEKQRSTPN